MSAYSKQDRRDGLAGRIIRAVVWLPIVGLARLLSGPEHDEPPLPAEEILHG